MPSPVELNELRNMSGGVRKRILELLHGLHVPKTLTAAQAGTIQSVVADDVGQFMRVGPFPIEGLRTDAYDWWVAQTVEPTVWRQLDAYSLAYLSSIFATIASVALKAPLASPHLTGIPTTSAVAVGTDTSQIATAALVKASMDVALAGLLTKAPITSPNFLGSPAAITPATSDNSTRLATTAFVKAVVAAVQAVPQGVNFVSSDTPPLDLAVIWHDTNDNTLNFWDGNVWVCSGIAATAPSIASRYRTADNGSYLTSDGGFYLVAA